jgi:two-component system, OmpR family, sensor histidine kinase MtrB
VGIGARITAIFALGAFVLSISMGGLAYFTTRHFLLAERESAAQTQTFANAQTLLSKVEYGQTAPAGYEALLAQLDAGSDSNSILIHHGVPYTSSISTSESSIPARLRAEVLAGTVATETYDTGSNGQPQIAVGVRISSIHSYYFEVFSLSDLGHILDVLSTTLIVAGVVTTLLGAGLGRFASRRSLRPLTDVSRAAVAIAGGQLDTRLPSETSDPDLGGLTTSFNAMVDQIQSRIEREARFNSDVSHELRSPLTTLAASLEVLERDLAELSPRAQRALQLLGEDLRRFQRMVGDLLEISRADAGSMDVFLDEVNVGELVRRTIEAGVRTLGEGATAPEVHISPDLEMVHVGVDKRRFERVMTNLLENAENYGGGAVSISVDASENGTPGQRSVQIAVEDAGPGIDASERTKVFERFYRGSASGRRGTGTGTGLGLALVAEHMRLMHGEAWAESSSTGGARFVIALPVLDENAASTW